MVIYILEQRIENTEAHQKGFEEGRKELLEQQNQKRIKLQKELCERGKKRMAKSEK